MPTTSSTDVAPSAPTHGSGKFFSRKASIFYSGRNRADRDSAITPTSPPSGSVGVGWGAGSGTGIAAPETLRPPARLIKHQKNKSSEGGASSGSGTAGEPPSPPRSRKKGRHSLSSSVTDFGNALRRSASLRSNSGRSPTSPSEQHPYGNGGFGADGFDRPQLGTNKSALSLSSFTRRKKSIESIKSLKLGPTGSLPPEGTYPALEGQRNISTSMSGIQVRQAAPRPTGTSQSNVGFGESKASMAGSAPVIPALPTGATAPGMPNANATFAHIHEMAAKRLNTLDYLRKAHEGHTYYFNTLLFSQSDLGRLPSHQPPKLARRATNFLLLGFSLPQVLDFSTSQSASDYLRVLNSLLIEFEQYQTLHPPDGPMGGSLTKARIPQMFRRATGASKARRASSAADLTLLGAAAGGTDGTSESTPTTSTAAGTAAALPSLTTQTSNSSTMALPLDGSFTAGGASWAGDPAFSSSPTTGSAGESYTHLMTPNLPFDPDFFSTFVTLCDVLIDVYRGIMELVSTPDRVAPGVGELFSKADAKVRKILVSGIVREFEDSARAGIKTEVAGIGKVVLGGLM